MLGVLALLALGTLLSACAMMPVSIEFGSGAGGSFAIGSGGVSADHTQTVAVDRRGTDAHSAQLSDRQIRILRAAEDILRTQSFVVNGYRYSYDCTGTILAIYAMAGLNVVDLFPRYTGNGVARLYAIARDYDLLYDTVYPAPGDLIFWDNTYDRAGDKRWNDDLTHVGMVISVDANGQIEYLHHHYTQGVVVDRMNLRDPETHLGPGGIVVNSPMRMRSHRYINPDQWLASHLYRRMGALHRIPM
ncbi:MAG: CHAP domain-containing protein [Spirochaetaceae bacterium]|nr:MAG: CHAP domain-containing protein [Spirochaetaceae bacterium]